MIKMYPPNSTSFNHNKYVLTEILKCEIEEKLNGIFNLYIEYPLFDKKGFSNMLSRGWVISAPVPDNRPNQLFRVVDLNSVSSTSTIKATCKCIGITDLGSNMIRDTNVVGKNRLQAVQQILSNTLDAHKFTATGDNTASQNNLRVVRMSPLQALIGSDSNTVLSRYGGEITFNNFEIKVENTHTRPKPVDIKYGKNLEGVEVSMDDSELVTRIIPMGANGLLLPEYFVDSPLINNYERVYNKVVEFPDISVVEGEEDDEGNITGGVTEAEAIVKLREAANRMFSEQKVDAIPFNYKVNFQDLGKTEEYQSLIALQRVHLGDKVNIQYSGMNINLLGRVISYRYDCLSDNYIMVELGVTKRTLSDSLNESNKVVNLTKQLIELGVSSLDGKLSAQIKIVENQITQEVASGKIVQKVSEALSADGKIATSVYEFTKDGGRYIHSNSNTYTDLTAEGMGIYKNDGTLVAYYRENAYVPEQSSDTINVSKGLYAPNVMQFNRGDNHLELFVSPGGSGDLSGRDENNCSPDIQTAFCNATGAQYDLATNDLGGCSYNGSITITVKSGTYEGDNHYVKFNGITGAHNVEIYFETGVAYKGQFEVNNCTKQFNFNSTGDATWDSPGGKLYPQNGRAAIIFRNSVGGLWGLYIQIGYTESDWNLGVHAVDGSSVEIINCDFYKVRVAYKAEGAGSYIYAYNNRGGQMHNYGWVVRGGRIKNIGLTPNSNQGLNGCWNDLWGEYSQHDCTTKESASWTPPPTQDKVFTATFGPHNVYSSRNYSESGIFYQAGWHSGDADIWGYWTGVAHFGGQIPSFISGGFNTSATVSFTTEGGSYGYSSDREVKMTTSIGSEGQSIGNANRGGSYTFNIPSGTLLNHILNGGDFMIHSKSSSNYLKVIPSSIRIHVTTTKTV